MPFTHYKNTLDNNTENVRMDFIFSHTDGLSDSFYCEDKPNNNDLKDQRKTQNVRDQSLKYWSFFYPIQNVYHTLL